VGCGKKKGSKKKVALVVLFAMLVCGLAYGADTGTTLWHKHSYVDKDSYVDKYSEYQKKLGWPMGVGVDAILYEFEPSLSQYGFDSINSETKYDIVNGSMSVYGVVHVNLWQAGKKLLGK